MATQQMNIGQSITMIFPNPQIHEFPGIGIEYTSDEFSRHGGTISVISLTGKGSEFPL